MGSKAYPGTGIDLTVAVSDLARWRTVPGPEPDLDGDSGTLHSEPAAPVGVKLGTVRGFMGVPNTTPRIAVDESVAVRGRDATGLVSGAGHSASWSGVKGRKVRAHVVHALKDINFAPVRPVRAGLPHRGPCTTALWHVPNVEAVDGGA